MIIKLIVLIIFNLIYSLNNYNGIANLIIINAILFLFDILICRIKINSSLKKICLSSIITLFLIIINKNIFIYGYKDINLLITTLDIDKIEINSLYLDNNKYKFYDEDFDSNIYDIYNKITPNYKLNLVNNYILKINKAKKITINFEKYNYSYKLLINDDIIEINQSVVDNNSAYYKIYDNYYTYEFDNINYDNDYKLINFIISFLGLNIIILSFIDTLLAKRLDVLFLILTLFVFEYNSDILLNILTKTCIFIFAIFISIIINKLKLGLQKDKKSILLILLSSLVFTFCLIGSIYLNTYISISNIFVFIFTTLWLSFIVILFKYFINYISKKLVSQNNKKILDRIILFLIPLIIFLVYLYIFSPYICTTDGSMQLKEIESNSLTNWHPFFHTLLMSFIYNMFGNFQIFIILRLILVSCLISFIGTYFIRKGINRIFIYILVLFLVLNPVMGVYMVSILKDVDYIIFLILLTFLLIKYINNDFKLIDYLFLFISLLFIALFRHNGLYVSLVCALVLIIFAIKNKNIKFIVICVLTPIIIYVINNNVYNYFNVQIGLKNSDVVTLAHGLQAVYATNGDDDINDFFSEYNIDSAELRDSYNKYNIDILLHYNKTPLRDVEINKINLNKFYLKNLFKYPNILLKDRLLGTDIIWDITKSDKIQTYDYQIDKDEFGFIYYNEKDIELHDSSLKRTIVKILLFISNNKILNALFLRAGLYLCMLFMLFVNFYNKKDWLILCPFIINLLTLFIALHHQSYRYVMFMPLIFIIYFLHFILERNKS